MDIPSAIILYIVIMALLGAVIIIQKLKVRNTNGFLPLTLGQIDYAVITVDQDEHIEYVNDEAVKLLKYVEKDLLGKRINLFLEKVPDPELIKSKDNAQKPYQETFKSRCVDSKTNQIPILMTIKKIISDHGEAPGYIYLLKDITEDENNAKIIREKNIEFEQKNSVVSKLRIDVEKEKLSFDETINQKAKIFQEEHARLLASINNLSLGLIMTDKDTNITLNNRSAVLLVPALNVQSKSVIKLSQISDKLNIQVEKSIRDKKKVSLIDFELNAGYFNIFVSPILMDDIVRTCLGVVIIIENVNEHHGLEQSKEDLFSIASHELRTPLTAIYGYVSLIKQIYFADLKNDELKNIINNIGVLSKKLSLSINTFLDSSKLEQGKIEVKKEPYELYPIINEAVKETERISIEKNLYIKLDLPSMPIVVLGDKLRLIQVLIILISNAIKYTQNGGVFISVIPQDKFAKIIIKDTGSGIPEENKLLLFSKFQQTEENLLTRQEGTGLGLHMAKLLVEKMGGSIGLERTEVNKGSTFSFMIPVSK